MCTLDFTDGAGGTPGYFVGDSVFVQAEDVVYNTDPGSQQSMTVTLTNDRTGESEAVTLLETGDNTGIFSIAGGFPTTASGSTANNDGTLNVQYGDTVTVTSLTGGTGDQCLDTYRFPVPTEIVKAVDKSVAIEGETLTYTISANYPAGDVLTDVTVTDSVPAGTTYVNGSVTAGGSESGGDLTWLLGSTVAGTPAYQAPGLTAFSALADATNDFGAQDSLDPSVAMDAAGKLHVAFVGKASGASRINIYYTNNVGGAWSTPLLLSNDTDGQDALAPSIAVDAGGNVHVVYTDDTNDAKRNAYYVKASAGGGVLAGPTRLSSDVNIVLTSDVAVDGNGYVHVVFGDKTATDARFNAYYRVSTNGGASFSAQERVSNDADGQDALVPAIAVSASGTAHIVYTDDTSDAVRNVYHVAGTTGSFSVPQRLSDDTDGQAATAPAVAVDGSGHAHVAYGDKQAGDARRNIYYTNNVGGGFAVPVDATADFSGQDSSLATVGVDVQGAAHLSFQNVGSDGGRIDIFYMNNQSGSFATPTQFTTNLDGQDSLNPDIAVGVNSVCVVFGARDPSDAKRNVYNTCADLLVGTSMSVSASPGVGTTGDTVMVTAVLTSTEDLTGVLPVLTPAGSNNMGVSLVAAPPAQNLTADTPAQFVWTYSITEGAGATPGQLTFQVAATNNDATFGLVDFGTADSNSLIATPPLKFQVTVDAGAASPVTNTASVADTTGYIPPTQSNEVETLVAKNNIGDFVWIDSDGDGVQDAGEPGLNGVTVNLLDASGNPTGFTTTTANNGTSDGFYEFTGVPDGSYIVEFIAPAAYDISPQDNATGGTADEIDSDAEPASGRTDVFAVAGGDIDLSLDAGMYQPVSISGVVEYDNGAGNQPLGGVTLNLLDGNGDPVLDGGGQPITATTDPVTGAYSFTGLAPGTYQVSQTQPDGYQSTSDTDGANDNLIGDGTPITLSSGQSSTGNNFLEEQLGAITGAVLADDDNDGGGESGIGGVTLTLLDASGNPVDDPNQPGIQDYVVTSDSGTGAYAFINLPAGDYQVAEAQPGSYDSVSDADGGDLDLIGDQALIVVTAGGTNANNEFIEELPASLGDLVWLDLNGNGIQDGGAEVGLDGILVRLLDADNGNAEVATVITSGGGLYLFEDLTPGNYIVEFVVPDGYDITLQDQTGTEATDSDADPTSGQTDSIAIVRGDELTNVDAGLVPNGTGAIGNYVWLDENGDGVQDAGEAGIAGVTVELLNSVGGVIATTTTDADGGYLFTGLAPGDYTIRIDGGAAPAGMVLTSDPDSTADNEHPVSLAAGEEYLDADFGYNWVSALATDTPGSGEIGAIGDRVWSDADGDGVQDPGELGIPGVTLTLYEDLDGDGIFSDVVITVVTDADGSYVFPGLDPGAYVVEVLESSLPADYTQSGDPDATLDGATTTPIILAPGDVYVNADFGYQAQPSAAVADIGDTIYLDADASGSYSAAVDSGIAGVTVSLLDASGAVVATAITDASGAYLFADVPTGAGYTVVVTDTGSVLNGLINTGDPDAGGDSASAITAFAATDLDQDFGYAPAGHDPGEGLIGDTIFIDLDGDGSADPGEGTEGVTVRLYDATGTQLVAVTTTDENGNYYFGGLDSNATYTVKVDTGGTLSGLTNTVDPDTGGDSSSLVDLSADADGIVLTQDFGYEGNNTISGIVWEDPDADGTRSGGETVRLDGVTVDLIDASGNIIGTTTTDVTGAYSFDNLPDGDYTVDVTDTANVLDGYWHSLGTDSAPDPTAVTVNSGSPAATLDFGYYIDPAVIGDFVWHDLNGDGEQDSGEPGIGGVEVTLTVVYATNDTVTVTTTTAPDGSYSFAGLLDEDFSATGGAGDPVYTVTVATPPGFAPTTSNAGAVADTLDSDDGIAGETAELVQGGSDPTNDFGFVQTASIGNYVWFDENGDGVQDAGEDGIPGVLVELHDQFGATIASTYTDADGGYLFTNVPTGVPVMVCVKTHSLPLGMTNQTGDPDAVLDDEHTVTLSPGEEYMSADFGYNYAPASDTDTPTATSTGSIGDRIWIDADSDGVQDDGEAGLAGVEVKLYTDPDGDGIYDNLQDTTTTDVHGNYIFDDSPPDSYRVEVTPPVGYTQTGDPDGTLDGATTSPIILAPGDVYANADFGYVLDSGAADIGDKIYLDTDANGSFDGSDVGIAGVTVALTDGAGNVIATATTDAGGNYLFPGLPSGVSYQVIVTDTDHVLGNLAQTGDPDATLDGKGTVASLAPTGDLDQDFGYAPLGHDPGEGLIGDSVFLDTDNSGTLTAGEGIEGVTVSLYDATGTTLITSTVTDENGNYWFGGLDPTATYTVKVDTTGTLSGLVNTIDPDTINPGDSESLVALSASGGIDLDQDFGYVGPNDISGIVWLDPDADGTRASGETVRFGGITVDLLDPDGNIVATTTTLPDGSYSFDNVPDGDYTVDITDDANVLAGYWHSLGTDSAPDPAPVTVNGGNPSATIDFGYYIDLASVGNYVFNDANFDGVQDAGDTPISGAVVTLTVTYPNGAVITATTITAGDGSYSFDNLLADEDYSASGGVGEPTFQLTAATPAGLTPTFSNVGADDTADSDDGVAGELAEIVQGGSDTSNDFGYTSIKPDSWINWQTANAADLGTLTGPAGNADGDLSDNLLEYALCLDPGTGSPQRAPNASERGGFCVVESGGGGLDAFFTRPLGGLADVTYTLEVAPALGSPTAWTDVTSGLTPTITDNGDGTETVTYADLELLDGTTAEGIDLSAGIGFARLRVDLDDGTTTATSHTEVFGWSTLSAQAECETCSNPFAPKDVFSGTVTLASGALLDVSGSAGTGTRGVVAQMAARPHYIEIVGGTYEGHRFEVAAATDQSITLALGAARNTLDPIPDLTAAPFVLRAHNVLDDIVSAADFVDTVTPSNNDDPATAGRLLFFDHVNGWSTYFAFDDSGGITPQWTSADNSFLRNVGDAVLAGGNDELVIIAPCAGFYVHSKAQAVDVLMVGVVRTWDFACPLGVGYNFVGSAYPLVQSPDSRDMTLSYFTGSPDPATSDQVEFWLSDGGAFGLMGYDSHFRVLSGSYDHWTTQENSALVSENGADLFEIQRAAFIKSVNGNDKSVPASVWLWPAPWSP